MHIATNPDLSINVDNMHKYVASVVVLKEMLHMLLDELERGSQAMYLDAMEVRVRF